MGRKGKVKEAVLQLLRTRGREGVPQSLIHRVLGFSKSRVSEVLTQLEVEGLVIRERVGNQFLVKLTPEARNILAETVTKKSEAMKRVVRLGLVWSSEYPFITPFAKKLWNRGVVLEIRVFSSAVEATAALVRGDVELALTPLVTQLHFHSAFRNFKIVGGGAYGGASVLRNPRFKSGVVASSKLSTMDAIRAIAIDKGDVEAERTTYFSRPKEAVRLAVEGVAEYVVAWHPLNRELSLIGMKEVSTMDEYGVGYCCTLAVTTALPRDVRERLAKDYTESMKDFLQDRQKWIPWYSLRVGINPDLVRQGWESNYMLNPTVSKSEVIKFARKVGLKIPDPGALAEAVEEHES